MPKAPPTEAHLTRMYHELAKIGAACVGEKRPWPYHPANIEELITLAADISRHDPRLVTILVKFLSDKWSSLNPAQIRANYPSMDTPQTLAVLAQFILDNRAIPLEERYFFEYLKRGLPAVPLQFYFHHIYSPGGALAERAMNSSLAEYKKWGFLACEAPVLDEGRRKTIGKLDVASRKNALLKLLTAKKEIRIADYIAACGGHISRQQALIDLKSSKIAKISGRGRGARWQLKPSKNS